MFVLIRFNIDWSSNDGVSAQTHQDYVKDFCETFYSKVTSMIDSAASKFQHFEQGSTFSEVLHHAHICADVSKVFLGREAEQEKVR